MKYRAALQNLARRKATDEEVIRHLRVFDSATLRSTLVNMPAAQARCANDEELNALKQTERCARKVLEARVCTAE
jgi:hypothetical protein